MKTSMGIIYICTGAYSVFWDDFYCSFEKYFMAEYEKHYYLFTDNEKLLAIVDDRIHVYRIENQPWPLITLLRFGTFLKQEETMKKHDFLMFSNANIVCCTMIKPQEILPNREKGETLFFTQHPGYYNKKPWNTPLDRNKRSRAYVPYCGGDTYVIGAFFGGYTTEFLKMTHTLNERICEDLKQGIIARWHDESHINHYIIGRKGIRIISPEYCYPVGALEIKGEKKIAAVSKSDKFDVNTFKGFYKEQETSRIKSRIKRVEKMLEPMKIYFFVIRDFLLKRKKAV